MRADVFVLACGGIENSRLLLHINRESEGAVVGVADALGRYWMEHPHFDIGAVLFFDDDPANFGRFALTGEAQRELGILNCSLRVRRNRYAGTKKLISDIACVAPRLAMWGAAQIGYRMTCGALLRAAWEQEPRRANRIELSKSDRDQFGIPRPVLYWEKSEADTRTVRETALRFGTWLADSQRGRVWLENWVLGSDDYPTADELAGYHHMGGTRMSATPEEGVVDADLKVWGKTNLFICGSSVFPSSGHANPTQTIVQLALRLGDHIASLS